MAALARLVLRALYPGGLPARLFWLADSRQTEKPYAKRVAAVEWLHRTKRGAGRAQKPGSYPEIFEKGKAPPTLPEKESFGCFL